MIVIEWTRPNYTKIIVEKPSGKKSPRPPSVPIKDPVIGLTTTQDGGW